MTQLSDYAAAGLAGLTLNNTAFASPAQLYMSLHLTNPLDDDSGTEVTNAFGYSARPAVQFGAPASRQCTNSSAVAFGPASGGNWGNVGFFGLYDSATIGAGNLWFYEGLDSVQTINDGDSRTLPIGNLNVELREAFSTYLSHALLNHCLRNIAYTSPTQTYLGIFETDPTPDASGTEIAGNAYARQLLSWGTQTNGLVITDTALTYPVATPAGQGDANYGAVFDAQNGGNMMFYGALENPQTIGLNEYLDVPLGNFRVRID